MNVMTETKSAFVWPENESKRNLPGKTGDWFQCKTGSFFKEKHENLYSGISRRERHAGCRDRI